MSLLRVLLLLLPLPALAGTTLHTWDLDDPAATDCPVCEDTYQCVAGAYSELWQDRLSFEDELPEGTVVVGVDVTLTGVFGCDAPSSLQLRLAETLIEDKELPGTCDCGDCASHTLSAVAKEEWPGYAYGDVNHLDFVPSGIFCVDSVQLTLTWEEGPAPPDDDDSASGDDDDATWDDDDDTVGDDDDDLSDDDDDDTVPSDDDDDDDDGAQAGGSRSFCSAAPGGALLALLPLLLRRRR